MKKNVELYPKFIYEGFVQGFDFLAFSSQKLKWEINAKMWFTTTFVSKKKSNTANSVPQGNFWITITKATSKVVLLADD